jgi:hypothetical protein
MKKYFLFLLLSIFCGHFLSAQSYESKPAKQNNTSKSDSVEDTIILIPDTKNTNSSASPFFAPANKYESKASHQQKKMTDSTINTPFIKTPEMRTPEKTKGKNSK